MARVVKDTNLATGEARRRLKARGKPYYHVIDEGLHIGYRKPQSGSGKWVVRRYVGRCRRKDETLVGTYEVAVIGIADDMSDANDATVFNFSQAQAKARELRDQRDRTAAGKANGPLTVGDAMKNYLQWLEDEGKPIVDTKSRINALITPLLGDVRVDELTSQQVTRWRVEVAKMPARVRTRKGEPQRYKQQPDDDETRRRRRASTNRTFTILKAGLNRAFNGGAVTSDKAWRTVRLYKGVSSARVRYLTIDESKRLINASDPDFRRLAQAALLTGARYSELGRLQVTDFNPDVGTLAVRKSKSAKPRHIVLTTEGARYFARVTAGRAGSEVMLKKADGTAWRAGHQRVPMMDAVARAKRWPSASTACGTRGPVTRS
jgi:integrase